MKSTVLKVVVLLFFFSGITLFVMLQSGYFDGSEKPPKRISPKSDSPETVDTNWSEPEVKAVDEAPEAPKEKVNKTAFKPMLDKELDSVLKDQPKMEPIPKSDRWMYSSKSLRMKPFISNSVRDSLLFQKKLDSFHRNNR